MGKRTPEVREIFIQERFFDPLDMPTFLADVPQKKSRHILEGHVHLEKIMEDLTAFSDAVMEKAGQLVLSDFDYNGRNKRLAQ